MNTFLSYLKKLSADFDYFIRFTDLHLVLLIWVGQHDSNFVLFHFFFNVLIYLSCELMVWLFIILPLKQLHCKYHFYVVSSYFSFCGQHFLEASWSGSTHLFLKKEGIAFFKVVSTCSVHLLVWVFGYVSKNVDWKNKIVHPQFLFVS